MKRNADLQNISLERILDGSLKSIPIVNKTQFKDINAVDGDLIYIREHPYRQATISGAVLKPGTYTVTAGESLSNLVEKAGGYNDNAYIFGSVYQNEEAKLIDKKSKEVIYRDFLDNILALSQQSIGGSLDLSPLIELTKNVKDAKSNGRVVIDLEDENSIDKYKIKDGDHLHIPEETNVVYVYGEISTEGAVMFKEGSKLDFYIQKSGGYKKFADSDSIYVLHPNGESILYDKKRNIFESSPQSSVYIHPGSIIFIPRKLDESTPRRLATQAYVSILGNLGIALASLSSINNN